MTGFDENVPAMLAFESQWKLRRDSLRLTSAMQIADLGRSLIGTWQQTNGNVVNLHYIATGTIGVLNTRETESLQT